MKPQNHEYFTVKAARDYVEGTRSLQEHMQTHLKHSGQHEEGGLAGCLIRKQVEGERGGRVSQSLRVLGGAWTGGKSRRGKARQGEARRSEARQGVKCFGVCSCSRRTSQDLIFIFGKVLFW